MEGFSKSKWKRNGRVREGTRLAGGKVAAFVVGVSLKVETFKQN